MVRDLIVSVAYRYPAGSLLSMPVYTESFALRPFEGSGENLKTKPHLMILDGQQRLTSLYQALFSENGVQFGKKTYHFYLDVTLLMSDPDGSIEVGDPFFEQSLFYVTEDSKHKRNRYQGLKKLYEITDSEQELDAGAMPLRYTFDTTGKLDDWKMAYLTKLSDDKMDAFKAFTKKWDNLVRPWLDRIKTYPFPMVELRPDLPMGAICHIFEKVNSTGVPLDVFDLCTAILWAQGFELNVVWQKTSNELAGNIKMQPLNGNGTYFLQSISLLDSYERKQKDLEGRIAVACRKQDLMAMNKATVEKWWPILQQGYIDAGRFMENEGVITQSLLPYHTLIVPLSAVLGYLRWMKGQVAVEAVWPKIEKWYWCSIFSQRYSSQTESNSAKDFEEVINWVNGGDQPEIVKTFTFRSDALQEIQSIRNVIYKGILCLFAKQHALDFGGGGQINNKLYYDLSMDHHHIFPTKYMSDMGIKDDRANTIVNKTLIGAEVNRSISGEAPSIYVDNWRNKLGKNSTGRYRFDEILESHAIDPDALSANAWDKYIALRREKLRQLIISVCGGNVQPFTDEYDPSMEEPDEENLNP